MPKQNIFDNQTFFSEYQKLRDNRANYNNLIEQPAMKKLMPDTAGKSVLDLGCGCGQSCVDFVRNGAESVLGIDISEKMLAVANKEAKNDKIKYLQMSMSELDKLSMKFDIVYSSLAFHYVPDFQKFANDIYNLLNTGGYLLFSQEHPIVTATFDGKQHYNKDENGNYTSFTFSNYNQPGERDTFWYVDGVKKYHRTFSNIISALCRVGFVIDTVCEPSPIENATDFIPNILEKELIKPTFLIVKASK
mgnify:FL=1